MSDLLDTYLTEVASAGVDLYSDSPGKDEVSLDAFDEVLGVLETPQKTIVPVKASKRQAAPRSEKKKTLMLPPGSGDGWA